MTRCDWCGGPLDEDLPVDISIDWNAPPTTCYHCLVQRMEDRRCGQVHMLDILECA